MWFRVQQKWNHADTCWESTWTSEMWVGVSTSEAFGLFGPHQLWPLLGCLCRQNQLSVSSTAPEVLKGRQPAKLSSPDWQKLFLSRLHEGCYRKKSLFIDSEILFPLLQGEGICPQGDWKAHADRGSFDHSLHILLICTEHTNSRRSVWFNVLSADRMHDWACQKKENRPRV